MLERNDDLLNMLWFFRSYVIFKFFKISSHVHKMDLTSFITSVIPESDDWRAIKRSDSVDIVISDGLLIKKFRIFINVLFFITSFWIIIESCSMKFGPFVKINEIIFGVITTTLNCVNLVWIFRHVLESWEYLKRRTFVNKINWQWRPFDV